MNNGFKKYLHLSIQLSFYLAVIVTILGVSIAEDALAMVIHNEIISYENDLKKKVDRLRGPDQKKMSEQASSAFERDLKDNKNPVNRYIKKRANVNNSTPATFTTNKDTGRLEQVGGRTIKMEVTRTGPSGLGGKPIINNTEPDWCHGGGMNSSGIHVSGNYQIEFFHPSCNNYNFYCKDGGYCGMSPDRFYECNKDIDCNVVLTIYDKLGNLKLKGYGSGWHHKNSKLRANEEIFGDVIKLEKMPKDFPYLVLKDRNFGSWGSGYYYHLYSTKDKLKKIIKIGPSHDGFYKNSRGNYIIDIQSNYWPTNGSNSDHLVDEISYRLSSEQEYIKTGELSVIDIGANISRLIQFSDNEIKRLMVHARKFSKKIKKAFDKDLELPFVWMPSQRNIKEWPLQLLKIRDSDPYYDYAYGDLFDLIRNGRIDLAKKYFNILIPEQYNQFKKILPENLNTKSKLWQGYLNNLRRDGELHWPLLEQLNSGLI